MQGSQPHDDENEYLDYSYSKFNHESRSRTSSLHNNSQVMQDPLPHNPTPFRQPLYMPNQMPMSMPSPANMQGVDMMSFMQQMQNMQQMMTQFQMFQMINQGQPTFAPQADTSNNSLYKEKLEQPERMPKTKRPHDREFRDEREVTKEHLKTDHLSQYMSIDKSRDNESLTAPNDLNKYFNEDKRLEQGSGKKAEAIPSYRREEKSQPVTQSNNFVHSFDEMPIKPAMQESGFDHAPNYPPQIREVKSKPSIRASKKNVNEFQEKPVRGIQKEFNAYLEEVVNDQEDFGSRNESSSRPRNFLKKGTRQFLSSARSKMKPSRNHTEEEERPKMEVPSSRAKKVEVTKPIPKNKVPQNEPTRFKIETEEYDDPLFHASEKQSKYSNKSPKPIKSKEPKPSKTKPMPKLEKSLNESSVESIHDEQKVELVRGVVVTLNQFNEIKMKYMMENESMQEEMDSMRKLKVKYEEMARLVEEERAKLFEELERQKEALEEYKEDEMKKISNLKRVAERQKQAVCNVNYKKEKEDLEAQKKKWEQEKEQMKKKDTSSKFVIQKLKKEVEDLKRQALLRDSETTGRKRESLFLEKESSKDKKDISKPKFGQREREKSIDGMSDKDRNSGKNTSFTISKDGGKSTLNKTKTIENSSTKPQTASQELNYDDLKFSHGSISKSNLQTKPVSLATQEPTIISKTKGYSYQQEKGASSEDSYHSEEQEEINEQQSARVTSLEELISKPMDIRMVTDQMIEDLFHYDNNEYFLHYINQKKKQRAIKGVSNDESGKTATTFIDGSTETLFANGVKKEVFPNGYCIVHFNNKDVKQKLPDGTTLYYFKDKNVDQITFTSDMNIYRFENNQVEFHYPDGLIEIRHADGTIKTHHG